VRTFSSLAAAVIILGALAGPALATGSDDYRSSVNGSAADAATPTFCHTNPTLPNNSMSCTRGTFGIFEGKRQDSQNGVSHVRLVCVSWSEVTFDDDTPVNEKTGEVFGWETNGGCNMTADTSFGDRLTSAALPPTTVIINRFGCDETGCYIRSSFPIVVGGAWTATGTVVPAKYHTVDMGGGCRFTSTANAESRVATFVGTVDGHAVTDTRASISDGMGSFSQNCH
jgi:hypothetical protein